MKRVGVLLSGCGVFDGAEIHESVITLLALDRAGVETICIAPDIKQRHVVNHLTGEEMSEERNVLVESARIARGEIKALSDVSSESLDALILPGGFGAAKNLCDFALKGSDCEVLPEVKAFVLEFVSQKKPVGAFCIAPALISKVFEGQGKVLTVGSDPETVKVLESLGARHQVCSVSDIAFDESLNLVSTPAYMLAGSIAEAALGIEKAVAKILELIK